MAHRAYMPQLVHWRQAHALLAPVEAILGASGAPERDALPESVREDRDGDDAADVDAHLRPPRDVPERIPKRDGAGHGHEGSNDNMGRMAAAAEYGSRAPATTSSKTAAKRPVLRP